MAKVCLECANRSRFKWLPCEDHTPAINAAECSHENKSETILSNSPNGLKCHNCNTAWVRVCNRCETPVTLIGLSNGYHSVCQQHDEDLYNGETYLKPIN